jgi:hypothetical protein
MTRIPHTTVLRRREMDAVVARGPAALAEWLMRELGEESCAELLQSLQAALAEAKRSRG